jgi:hypothetical protein
VGSVESATITDCPTENSFPTTVNVNVLDPVPIVSLSLLVALVPGALSALDALAAALVSLVAALLSLVAALEALVDTLVAVLFACPAHVLISVTNPGKAAAKVAALVLKLVGDDRDGAVGSVVIVCEIAIIEVLEF